MFLWKYLSLINSQVVAEDLRLALWANRSWIRFRSFGS